MRPQSEAFKQIQALQPGGSMILHKPRQQIGAWCIKLWGKASYRTSKEAGGVRVTRL